MTRLEKQDHPDKNETIKRRSRELWERTGRDPELEQDCWDRAVQEFEAGTSEAVRGPTRTDPAVEK